MIIFRCIVFLVVSCLPALAGSNNIHYDQIAVPKADRVIPVKIYLPPTTMQEPQPLILFSHGLGGSREAATYLGSGWAEEGFIGLFIQHPGSDESVWKDLPRHRRWKALKEAASGKNFILRARDIQWVLLQLKTWHQDPDHPLFQRCDLSSIGMAGHSFGAVTSQAVAGQQFSTRQGNAAPFAQPGVNSFLLLSPSRPKRISPAKAFSSVEKPVLCMTGTQDNSPLDPQVTPESRLDVYCALPPGNKFQLNLKDAPHSAFSDRARRGETHHSRYHPAILAISTAFWKATLKEDSTALEWLQSEEPRELLFPEDTWEWK